MAEGIEGFKVMSMEAMIEAAPEFILTNQDGTQAVDGVPVALKAPGALATPAGKAPKIRLRIDERGVKHVTARVVVRASVTGDPVTRIALGKIAVGRTVTVP